MNLSKTFTGQRSCDENLRRPIAICFLAILLFPLAGVAQPRFGEIDGQRKREIARLFEKFDRADSPGYAVGIVRNGNLIFARGFGSANLDYHAPITTQTAFNVASLSKQFTAACIAILIRRGRISLEDELA